VGGKGEDSSETSVTVYVITQGDIPKTITFTFTLIEYLKNE
jgi:hypothetical protein